MGEIFVGEEIKHQIGIKLSGQIWACIIYYIR